MTAGSGVPIGGVAGGGGTKGGEELEGESGPPGPLQQRGIGNGGTKGPPGPEAEEYGTLEDTRKKLAGVSSQMGSLGIDSGAIWGR